MMETTGEKAGGTDGQGQCDELQREAVRWVARLTSGEATLDDAERLKAWRGRSRAHEEAFRLAARTWRLAGHGVAAPAGRAPLLSRRLFLAGAGAGTALAAGWAGASLGLLPGLDQIFADYATGVGRQARIELPDGTAVDLDAASALNARVADGTRTAELVTGAAAFDIPAGAGTFVVTAGPCRVSTREAAFTLTAGSGPTRIECMRGSLDITGAASLTLHAGERVSLAAGTPARVAPVNPATVAAWRRGLLMFEDRPLAEVVDDINRHRRGRVVLARPGLGARRVDGVFHLERPDEIVDNLVTALGLAEIRLPGGIVILT